MAATKIPDHTVALSLSLFCSLSLSLGKVEIDGVRDLERWSERECVGEYQHSTESRKRKKKQHQNMSEWIITIPRHRGMVWEDGGEERRKEGRKEEAGG